MTISKTTKSGFNCKAASTAAATGDCTDDIKMALQDAGGVGKDAFVIVSQQDAWKRCHGALDAERKADLNRLNKGKQLPEVPVCLRKAVFFEAGRSEKQAMRQSPQILNNKRFTEEYVYSGYRPQDCKY